MDGLMNGSMLWIDAMDRCYGSMLRIDAMTVASQIRRQWQGNSWFLQDGFGLGG